MKSRKYRVAGQTPKPYSDWLLQGLEILTKLVATFPRLCSIIFGGTSYFPLSSLVQFVIETSFQKGIAPCLILIHVTCSSSFLFLTFVFSVDSTLSNVWQVCKSL